MSVLTRSIASVGFVALFVAGCATVGSPGGDPDKVLPPKMASSGRMPPLRFAMSQATGAPIQIDIEVAIDSTGVPIMSTFKAFGPMANENKDALSEWIGSSRFRPAVRNGRPVEAVYHQQLKIRLQR